MSDVKVQEVVEVFSEVVPAQKEQVVALAEAVS
jgi:hypothetical protein